MGLFDVILVYLIMNIIFLCLFLIIFKLILKRKMDNISKIADNEIMRYFNSYDDIHDDKFFNGGNNDEN